MNKAINYILPFFLIFIIGCAYEPILNSKNYLFSINVINSDGDEKINSILVNKFNTQKGLQKKYDLTFQSNKEKKVIAKDTKGDPTVFELSISVEYIVKNNGEDLIKKNITKKTTYNDISDKFELENYEKTIVKNLSLVIANSILSSISEINE